MLVLEAEIGERRSEGEALEDAVEVAGVAEVAEAHGGAGEAFVREEIGEPRHVQGHQR